MGTGDGADIVNKDAHPLVHTHICMTQKQSVLELGLWKLTTNYW